MKKTFTFFSIILLSVSLQSQSIEYSKNSLSTLVTVDGILATTTGVAAGYILGNGYIQNAAHVTIGYITNNAEIENATHAKVGYVLNDGTIQNALHQNVGKINDDGSILNELNQPAGKAAGVLKTWAAVCFFFYKVN